MWEVGWKAWKLGNTRYACKLLYECTSGATLQVLREMMNEEGNTGEQIYKERRQ